MEELVNRAVEAGAKELLKKSIEHMAPAAGAFTGLVITTLIEVGSYVVDKLSKECDHKDVGDDNYEPPSRY